MFSLALLAAITVDQWATLAGLIVSVGTILFFVKKIIIKWVASELVGIRAEVTPNGKDTQRTGDIVARTETKVDNLYDFMTRYAEKVDNIEKELSYLKGSHDNIKKHLSVE